MGTRIGAGRYLSVRWEARRREYFYSPFDPNPTAVLERDEPRLRRRRLQTTGFRLQQEKIPEA
jgi:hypothetical protein